MAIQRAINFFRPTITSSFHEREAAVASTRKSSPEMQFITENTSAMQYPRKGMAGSRKYIHCCGVLAFKCLRTRERAIDRCSSLSFSFSPLLELARNFHPSDSAKISRGQARIEGSNNGGARAPGIIFPPLSWERVLFLPADKRIYTRVTSIAVDTRCFAKYRASMAVYFNPVSLDRSNRDFRAFIEVNIFRMGGLI